MSDKEAIRAHSHPVHENTTAPPEETSTNPASKIRLIKRRIKGSQSKDWPIERSPTFNPKKPLLALTAANRV